MSAVRPFARRVSVLSIAAAAAVLAACASPQLDAQWVDASAGTDSKIMRGARVLVACDAADLVVRQICQEQLGREVGAHGATPIFASPQTPLATDRSLDAPLLPAARDAGASLPPRRPGAAARDCPFANSRMSALKRCACVLISPCGAPS